MIPKSRNELLYLHWDAFDDCSGRVANGLYLYTLSTTDYQETRKMSSARQMSSTLQIRSDVVDLLKDMNLI